MTNRQTVHKWIWVWDFEKEEQWLNEMAMNGWVLCSVGFCRFEFERCDPGEYTIRLELHGKDPEYLSFMEENGAEYIGSVTSWLYFRKKTSEGEFDIFSDIDSRIGHLNKIGKMLTAIGAINLFYGIFCSLNGLHFAWVNLVCAALLSYGLGRIHGKKETLEKERFLHE